MRLHLEHIGVDLLELILLFDTPFVDRSKLASHIVLLGKNIRHLLLNDLLSIVDSRDLALYFLVLGLIVFVHYSVVEVLFGALHLNVDSYDLRVHLDVRVLKFTYLFVETSDIRFGTFELLFYGRYGDPYIRAFAFYKLAFLFFVREKAFVLLYIVVARIPLIRDILLLPVDYEKIVSYKLEFELDIFEQFAEPRKLFERIVDLLLYLILLLDLSRVCYFRVFEIVLYVLKLL